MIPIHVKKNMVLKQEYFRAIVAVGRDKDGTKDSLRKKRNNNDIIAA